METQLQSLSATLNFDFVPTVTGIFVKLTWRLEIGCGLEDAGTAGAVCFTPKRTGVVIWSDFAEPGRLLHVDIPFGGFIANGVLDNGVTDEEMLRQGHFDDNDSAIIDTLFGRSVIDLLQTTPSAARCISIRESPAWADFGQLAVLFNQPELLDTSCAAKVGLVTTFAGGMVGIDHSIADELWGASATIQNDELSVELIKNYADVSLVGGDVKIRVSDSEASLIRAAESVHEGLLFKTKIRPYEVQPLFVVAGKDLPFEGMDKPQFLKRQVEYCTRVAISAWRIGAPVSFIDCWANRGKDLQDQFDSLKTAKVSF